MSAARIPESFRASVSGRPAAVISCAATGRWEASESMPAISASSSNGGACDVMGQLQGQPVENAWKLVEQVQLQKGHWSITFRDGRPVCGGHGGRGRWTCAAGFLVAGRKL